MGFDLLTIGEALVEVMRTGIDQPLHQPAPFIGPYPSGAPFIFAVQAARLGLNVAAIGAVGNDAFGQCLLNQLQTDGMTTVGVHVLQTHTTGVAFVAYNADGSRNFVFSLGAGGELTATMLDLSLFLDLRCLHLMGSTLSLNQTAYGMGERALQLAQANGAKFSFDPNIRSELLSVEEARVAFAPFIAAADVFLPTEGELITLTSAPNVQSAVDSLLAQKPERIVVVKQGAAGCTIYTQACSQHVAGFNVEEIDPTGAGDCFDAGFLAGWLDKLPLTEAARLANACGALAVTKQGPMAGAEKMAVVRDFMVNHPKT
jgi:sugar/nucleoside kinase (ribokinase family)